VLHKNHFAFYAALVDLYQISILKFKGELCMDSRKTNCEDDCYAIWHPDSNLTLIKPGTPTTAAITIPTAGTPTSTTVSTLPINTSFFAKDIIKLEFAGNVIFPNTQFDATLNFQIYRQYFNQTLTTAIGPNWVFSRQLAVAVGAGESVTLATSDTFSFFVYDFGSNQDGAIYTLVVTPNISTVAGIVTINNATLGAIVSGDRREKFH